MTSDSIYFSLFSWSDDKSITTFSSVLDETSHFCASVPLEGKSSFDWFLNIKSIYFMKLNGSPLVMGCVVFLEICDSNEIFDFVSTVLWVDFTNNLQGGVTGWKVGSLT